MTRVKQILNKQHEQLYPETTIPAVQGLQSALDSKQETLVSGHNIKTVNGESLLGDGNIVIEGGSGGEGTDPYAVKYTEQYLTAPQKAQARTNIGAGTSNFSGSFNDLTDAPTIPDEVVANPNVPPGTSSTTLTNIKVGNAYYSVPQGGGGSSSFRVEGTKLIITSTTATVQGNKLIL